MKKKMILIFFLLLIWVGIITGVVFLVKGLLKEKKEEVQEKTKVYEVVESLEIESGSELPSISDYFKGDVPSDAKISYIHRTVDITNIDNYFYYKESKKNITKGVYEINVEIVADKLYRSMLIIKDETVPEFKLKSLTIESYTNYEAKDFVEEYEDNSSLDKYEASFIGETPVEVGEYEITIKVCDTNDNCDQKTVKLEVIPGKVVIGNYTLDYGSYKGEVCSETLITHCEQSTIQLLGNRIKLNDDTTKKYIIDNGSLILSNGEVFKVIGDNKLEYQSTLKPIYEFIGE